MDIKMPIKVFGTYEVTVREGDSEKRETCQKLSMSKLAPAESSSDDPQESQAPTHLIVYYSFGCKRMVQGKLKENEEKKVVFEAQGKEYEFSTT